MREVSDSHGNISESYRYNAYGNPYEGRFRHSRNNKPYGFTGQRFEAETWMYSFAYRTYNPVSKRWMTPDPIRDGMNWYQYVRSDPVNLWDPLGLWKKDIHYGKSGEFDGTYEWALEVGFTEDEADI